MSDAISPQIIIDQPLPLLSHSASVNPTTANTPSIPSIDAQAVVPGNFPSNPHPQPIIAAETISQSLDTKSRKILGNYKFAQVGAIQVGEYVNGVSGQIVISPNGIIGTNVNGVNTFVIDGTTGDATFLGTIKAGSFIAGDSSVIVDGTSSGGRIVIFSSGVPIIVIGVV
ncbi:MAG: hypothetical protein KGI08_04770 [Thaumarchaeota archaeon]|nr:hypothetical protein [Nitrososphaerota archaeon]